MRWVRRREGGGGWLRVQLARAFQSRKHLSDPAEGQAKAIVGVLTSGGRGRERWLLENVGQRVLNEAEVAISDEHHVERVQKRLAVDGIRGGGNIFPERLTGSLWVNSSFKSRKAMESCSFTPVSPCVIRTSSSSEPITCEMELNAIRRK